MSISKCLKQVFIHLYVIVFVNVDERVCISLSHKHSFSTVESRFMEVYRIKVESVSENQNPLHENINEAVSFAVFLAQWCLPPASLKVYNNGLYLSLTLRLASLLPSYPNRVHIIQSRSRRSQASLRHYSWHKMTYGLI
jgi:hypothetical protein